MLYSEDSSLRHPRKASKRKYEDKINQRNDLYYLLLCDFQLQFNQIRLLGLVGVLRFSLVLPIMIKKVFEPLGTLELVLVVEERLELEPTVEVELELELQLEVNQLKATSGLSTNG